MLQVISKLLTNALLQDGCKQSGDLLFHASARKGWLWCVIQACRAVASYCSLRREGARWKLVADLSMKAVELLLLHSLEQLAE